MTIIKTVLLAAVVALGMSACHHDRDTNTPAQNTYGTTGGNGAASSNYGTAGTGAATPDVNSGTNGATGAAGVNDNNQNLANDQAAPGGAAQPGTSGTGTGMQPNGTYGQPGTPAPTTTPGSTSPTTTGSTGSSGTYGTGSNAIPSTGSGSNAYPYTGSGSNALPSTTGTGTGSNALPGTGMGSNINNPSTTNPSTGTTTQP